VTVGPAPQRVIFGADGTLLDTNYLHASAIGQLESGQQAMLGPQAAG
jgi:hypothetical protein